jgi:REP element-mobilizing transposase RayT
MTSGPRTPLPGPRASRPPLPSSRPPRSHKGWTSRGYLPHFDASTLIQAITFRLADSLPKAAYDDLAATAPDDSVLRRRIEAMIDSGRGACWLRDPSIAAIVQDSLWNFDGERYRLIAWTLMPNHVHVMIEQMEGFLLADCVHAWKSFTAKAANKHLGRTGAFWAPEYFDRYIRDQAHFDSAVHYIHENPVKAGLVVRSEDWQWSSAWKGN